MKLQTTIPLHPDGPPINYDSKIVLLGSCFSDHMGRKLNYLKFDTVQNPFGIIFNPLSIFNLLDRASTHRQFVEKDVFEKDGLWHCLEVHSLCNASEKAVYIDLLNEKLQQLRVGLQQATHIVLTLGTAWVYEYTKTRLVVANCHKIPQKEFAKRLLSVEDLTEVLGKINACIKTLNPNAHRIITVSPVRHIKDGVTENARSKAHLLSGIHRVKDIDSALKYFPSYEIMMDELRDYRFYEKDLLHPNETAISIIWEKFATVWVSTATIHLQKEIASIQAGLAHRPFNANSVEHVKFQKKLQERITQLKELLPAIDFS